MPTSQAVLDAWTLISPFNSADSEITKAQLNPRYRYLRVHAGEKSALLVLGYVDTSTQGNTEVWYSNDRGVLRLQGGRLSGLQGVGEDWLNVRFENLPNWKEVGSNPRFTRIRDVQPGYRFNIRDTLEMHAIPAPRDTHLQTIDPTALVWIEERSIPPSSLPPARYALQNVSKEEMQVVYGEQYLTPELKVSWQTWPPTR